MAKKKAARKARRKATKDLTASRKARGTTGGASFMPEVNDEVVVTFKPGALRAGAVVGNLWNGSDKPPTSKG